MPLSCAWKKCSKQDCAGKSVHIARYVLYAILFWLHSLFHEQERGKLVIHCVMELKLKKKRLTFAVYFAINFSKLILSGTSHWPLGYDCRLSFAKLFDLLTLIDRSSFLGHVKN